MTTVIRIMTFCMLVGGLMCFFSPMTSMLGHIPLLGGILKTVTELAVLLACLLVCIPIYLLMVSVAWLFYHPKVGIVILIIGIIGLAIIFAISLKRPPQQIIMAQLAYPPIMSGWPNGINGPLSQPIQFIHNIRRHWLIQPTPKLNI
jgi:hypothetical protein